MHLDADEARRLLELGVDLVGQRFEVIRESCILETIHEGSARPTDEPGR